MSNVIKRHNRLEFMGAMATGTPFLSMVSPDRAAMWSHHAEQACSPKHPDIPHILNGLETQMRAFDIRMPTDGIVVSVHNKFRKVFGSDSVNENPRMTIIFRDRETGEFDTLDIYEFATNHRVYGVKYILSDIVAKIRPGFAISKNTVLARSPNVLEGGIFSNSISCNVVNLSLPCTIEDGYGVSEDFCERASLLELPSVVGSWGRKTYPLNIYGTPDVFKAYPGVGDRIRDDGLVFAFREYNPKFDASEMTTKALMDVDTVNDIRIYSQPRAIVYDVTVESGIGESKSKPLTSTPMAAQSEVYIEHLRQYYSDIIRSCEKIQMEERNPRFSPRLINLVTRAYADQPNSGKQKSNIGGMVRRSHKLIPLDEYRVIIKCRRRLHIAAGSKITGLMGDKGVVCAVIPNADMPVDKDGNRADVIKFLKGGVARLNPGQFYEIFVNAASRDLAKWIKENINSLDINIIWQRLLSYYQAAAPITYDAVTHSGFTEQHKLQHLETIVQSGIYITIPANSKHLNKDIFKNILQVIQPTYGPVTYTNLLGQRVTTKDNVFIGIQQFIVLEKTDQNPMAIASSPLQIHGLLAGPHKLARNGHPSKQQAAKIISETEGRMFPALMGEIPAANYIALNNNPEAHKALVEEILVSPTPSNINPFLKIERGRSRSVEFIKNTLFSFGLELVVTD